MVDVPELFDEVAAAVLAEFVDLALPELVEAGTNAKPQEASKESTSPTEFVTASVGHENFALDCVTVTVRVTVDVATTAADIVTNS